MAPRLHRALAVVGAATLVVLPACTRAAGPSATVLAAAAAATAEAETARMAMHVGFSGGGQTFAFAAEGVGRLTPPMALQMTMEFGPQVIEMRVIDGAYYYGGEGVATLLGGTDAAVEWVQLDPEDLGVESEAMANGGLPSQDPTQMLAFLNGVSDDVAEVGQEDVRGAATTRYRATVDFERLLEAGGEIYTDTARAQMEQMQRQMGDLAIPLDAWIDEDGLARKVRMTMDIGKISAGAGVPQPPADAQMVMEFELYDFGIDVDVVPPPAEDVVQFADLAPPPA